jgi:hypothetical protein
VKFFARSSIGCLALVASVSHASAPDQALLGCWRAAKIVLYAPDGSRAEDTSGRCILQFKENQFESACGTATGTATTTYHYRIVRPNAFLATMAGSTFRTSLVGSTREYEYRVDGDRLVTVAQTQAASPASPTVAPRVESEATRMPCH